MVLAFDVEVAAPDGQVAVDRVASEARLVAEDGVAVATVYDSMECRLHEDLHGDGVVVVLAGRARIPRLDSMHDDSLRSIEYLPYALQALQVDSCAVHPYVIRDVFCTALAQRLVLVEHPHDVLRLGGMHVRAGLAHLGELIDPEREVDVEALDEQNSYRMLEVVLARDGAVGTIQSKPLVDLLVAARYHPSTV